MRVIVPKTCCFALYSGFEGWFPCIYLTLVYKRFGSYVDSYLQAPWTKRHDVFAYGILLLELITKQQYCCYDVHKWTNYQPGDPRSSVLHSSFNVDELSGSRITRLAMSCIDGQPAIEDIGMSWRNWLVLFQQTNHRRPIIEVLLFFRFW